MRMTLFYNLSTGVLLLYFDMSIYEELTIILAIP